MKNFLIQLYKNARLLNNHFINTALKEYGPFESILDVGCWDGELTCDYAKNCSAKNVYGIEIVKDIIEKAEKRGIKCFSLEADKDIWPIENESIDCVISNQVVEHMTDLDHFFEEASRVLKKDGILITSTNNLAAWHNIFSLFFGWAPFDLTNSSKKILGIGNFLATHKGEISNEATWTHKCIYTQKWLFEWQNLYNLRKVRLLGAGFYPFSAKLGNIFKNHAAFIILVTQKK